MSHDVPVKSVMCFDICNKNYEHSVAVRAAICNSGRTCNKRRQRMLTTSVDYRCPASTRRQRYSHSAVSCCNVTDDSQLEHE